MPLGLSGGGRIHLFLRFTGQVPLHRRPAWTLPQKVRAGRQLLSRARPFQRLLKGRVLGKHLKLCAVPPTSAAPPFGVQLYGRRGEQMQGLVHHSDRGVQYLAVRYTERLAEAGGVASRGDSYDCWPNPSTVSTRPS